MWVVQFELSAPFGHFRVPYTTIFKQTYPFPPKPTIIGMVGAMLGWDEATTLAESVSFKTGVFEWGNHGQFVECWHIHARKGTSAELRLERFEILVRPKFRLLVAHDDSARIKEIARRISTHDFEFPLYMGKNEFVATSISLLAEPYQDELAEIQRPAGIIFLPGTKLPKFRATRSEQRVPRAFLGVPLTLGYRSGSKLRIQKTICTALAATDPIELVEPASVRGFRSPVEVAVV